MMVLKAEEFSNFLLHLSENTELYNQVIVPYPSGTGHFNYSVLNALKNKTPDFSSFRSITPIKYLFYFPREKVYPVERKYPSRLIAGIKACDLKALEILDTALIKQNFHEPSYLKWRESTTIISSDCSGICSSCSCNLFGGAPYPEKGFDVNLSKLNGEYLLTPGSEKGEKLLSMIRIHTDVREANQNDLNNMYASREEIKEKLKIQNEQYAFPDNPGLRGVPSAGWESESKECVGCGACTNVCPTCYCLILNDESTSHNFTKVRSYDSCQWYGYARVAGGGTPRHKMHDRFRNRYLCKMDYMKENFGVYGCTGCGRCTEACAAKIDFRNVLKNQSTFSLEPKTDVREYEQSL
jgi:sulfhydrogenase subunit beta (sulfur reductase)